MAKKKSNEGASRAQTTKLLSLIGQPSLLTFLQRHFTTQNPKSRGNTAIRMCCPIHGDSTPSLDFDVISNTIHCYGCLYHERDLLQFLQDALGWSYSDSAKAVQDQTNVRIFNGKQSEQLDKLDTHRMAMSILMAACNKFLQDMILYWKSGETSDPTNYSTSVLESVTPTLVWLFEERKHDPGLVNKFPYGVLPSPNVLKHLVSNRLAELLERNRIAGRMMIPSTRAEAVSRRAHEIIDRIDISWVYSVCFFSGHSHNIPGRIVLRKPHGHKDIFVTEAFDDNERVGFFGLYRPFSLYSAGDLRSMTPVVVEGENDCISFLEGLVHAGRTEPLVMATGGSKNDLDDLVSAGFNKIILFADDPLTGNGNDYIKGRLATAFELDVRIFNAWPILRTVGVKDPDDAIQVQGFDAVYKAVIETPANLVTIDTWAREYAMAAYHLLDDQTDVREKTRIASDFGKYVRHPALQQQYIKDISKAFDINSGVVQQEILKRQDTEESFILRIAETLKRDCHIVCKEEDNRNSYLLLFSREKDRVVKLPMHDGEAAAIQLAGIYGPIYEFFQSSIGLPGFLAPPEGMEDSPVLQTIKNTYKDICGYLKIALQHLYEGIMDRKFCTELGQGVHVIQDSSDRTVVYIVNGPSVYKCEYEPEIELIEKAPPAVWKKLPGPSDGNFLFNVGFESPVESWSREIRSVADLNDGNDIDITASVRTIYDLFNTHWNFKHQRLDAQFLSYHLFAAGVSRAFQSMVLVSFLGDTHSGKTTILNVFAGHSSKALQLLEQSVSFSNFTQASVYQKCNNTTLAIAFDEYEDERDTTHKAKQVADINDMLRQIINDEPTAITRATKEGTVRSYNLRSFIFTAAIKSPSKAQDSNRRYEIEMDKIEGHADVKQGILGNMQIEQYHVIRRAVTLGLLRYIPRLRHLSKEIERELLTNKVVPFNVDNRTLRNFVPAATIAALIGDDWRAFIRDCCTARKQKFDAVSKETTSQLLYDHVMFTSNVLVNDGGRGGARVSITTLLADVSTWSEINRSGCGFYFLPELKIGVIHWITAQTSLLHPWPAYANVPHRTLKESFDRYPRSIRTDDYEKLGVWPHVQGLIHGVKKSDVSVLNLEEFLNDANLNRTPSTVAVAQSAIEATADDGVPERRTKTNADDNLP
jgi:hypothetical protein